MSESGQTYEAMTVNERLFAADLIEEFDRAKLSRDLDEINAVLSQVGLWQDANGMNWSKEDNAQNQ